MYRVLLLAAAAAVATPALADPVPVTDLSTTATPPTNDGTSFTAPTGELRQNSDSSWSTATITSDTTLSSNGSLELTGNRTRVLNDLSGLGLSLDSLQSVTMDFLVTNGGSGGGIQAPVLRVYVQDGSTVSELIWEAVYNGGNQVGTTVLGAGDESASGWHQYVYGPTGPVGGTNTFVPGTSTYVYDTLAGWAGSSYYTDAAQILGSGGGAGDSFQAYADNLTLNTTAGTTTYDFQALPAVPEPSTWAMMLVGFGGVGAAMRRRRKPVLAQTA